MMQDLIARYSDRTRYNLLIPPTFAVSQVGGLYQVSFREVQLNPDVNSKEVYTYAGLNGIAIGKSGLDKLAALAGITWNHVESGFLDAPKGVLRYRAVGALRNSDGTPIIAVATKTHFYTTPTPANFDCEKVETKAKNRVIRQLLGIKPTFSKDELQLPFVVLRVDLALDMNDPNIKMLVAQKAVDMMTNLFGAAAPAATQLTAHAMPASLPAPSLALPAAGSGTYLPESTAQDPEDLVDFDDDPTPPARQPAAQPTGGEVKCCTCTKTLSASDHKYTTEKGKPGQCYTCRQAKKPVPSSAMSPTVTPQGPKPSSTVMAPTKPQQAQQQAWAKIDDESGWPLEMHDPSGWSGKFPTLAEFSAMGDEERATWTARANRANEIANGQGTLPLAGNY